MLQFIALHLGTIIIATLVFAGVAGIVVKIVKDRKKGKCVGCSCGCEGCDASSETS